MSYAQIPFGSKQCYLTYRIGTFQLTRITLEILTTIRIKIKIQCLSLAAAQFQECLLDNTIGVDLNFTLLFGEKERKENMYPAPLWTWTGLRRQILPFATVIPPAGSSDMEPQKLRKPHQTHLFEFCFKNMNSLLFQFVTIQKFRKEKLDVMLRFLCSNWA